MTEDRLRRALDYEIEPWTPDPAVLIRDGRRLAWARRGAAAGAAVAVAAIVTGVAVALNGVTASQPPLSDQPSPSIAKPTVAPSPTPPCAYYTVKPGPYAVVPTAPPTRVARAPKVTSTPAKPPRVVTVPPKPIAKPRVWVVQRDGRCSVATPTVPHPRAAGCVRIVPREAKPPTYRVVPRCTIVYVRPTTPVPTSVPAGE
jgi:hypothetical protein